MSRAAHLCVQSTPKELCTMPFKDIKPDHPTPAEMAQVDSLIAQLEALLQPHLRNLSPEENRRYGRMTGRNSLAVDKVRQYHLNMPQLQSPDVDWEEFDRDYATRAFYTARSSRLSSLARAMTETRRLHDHDNLTNALNDYSYAQYKDRLQDGSGYDTKVADLKPLFGSRKASTVDDGLDNIDD